MTRRDEHIGDAHPEEHQHPYDIPYHWAMAPFYRYVNDVLASRVTPSVAGRAVLEMGCGDGYMTARLAEHARRVFAFDLSERAIAFAELIVRRPNVAFGVGMARDIAQMAGRLDGEVDVVASFEVVEHLSVAERDAFLAGAREVLKAGGSLVVSTPNGARRAGHVMNPHHAHEFTPRELRALLLDAGFADVQMSGVYRQPPWPHRLEHFANTVPFRAGFRRLARAGSANPGACRTLLAVCRA